MEEVIIGSLEAGQRFDKFLQKYLKDAGMGLIFKQLRKKNITLNGKKSDGKDVLQAGDKIAFFFAKDTYDKFRGIECDGKQNFIADEVYRKAYRSFPKMEVVYEDNQILIVNKPVGVLSQKAKPTDFSANEWVIGYLLEKGDLSESSLSTFKPAVCNRLDRNTSGLLIAGKTMAGLQTMNRIIASRQVHKFYHTIVKGQLKETLLLEGYLKKEEATNKVTIQKTATKQEQEDGFVSIKTFYKPLEVYKEFTLLEIQLITGKPHQIRAHLASIGHPILGDGKYGISAWNEKYRKAGVQYQLLHACRLEFPLIEQADISGKVISIDDPKLFEKILQQGER